MRAAARKYSEAHPLTAAQKARKAKVANAWRRKNAEHIREYRDRNRWRRNAARRATYARKPEKALEKVRQWREKHPGHYVRYRHQNIEKFRGEGCWSQRSKARRRAWRKFIQTCAANRRALQGVTRVEAH